MTFGDYVIQKKSVLALRRWKWVSRRSRLRLKGKGRNILLRQIAKHMSIENEGNLF